MKKLFFSLFFIALSTGGNAFAQDEASMNGAETAKFQQASDTGRCLVFNKYVIKTKSREDVGEDISVYRRPAEKNAKEVCQADNPLLVVIKNTDANYFMGIFQTFLFIDSGTGPDSRGLEIYSLETRKSVFTDEYHDTVKILPGNLVMFDRISAKAGAVKNCRQAAKLKKQGLSVGWVQDTQLDLKTMKRKPVGSLRCVAMQ
jgi:hypothetical protein